MTQEKITEGNKKIAKFLGWFQKTDSTYLYYEKDEIAARVAYDLRLSACRDLPFYRDWNYLMLTVKKLEDLGFCIHSANYSRDKKVKKDLADHIGFDIREDFYCDISGSIEENGTTRYFQIQRMDIERIESIFNTIIMFLEYYLDKTVRIVNISNGEVNRIEKI